MTESLSALTAASCIALLAGAGYAIVFDRTRRIEMAMLAHFALNAAHFLLFTYPRLAG